jgi:polysaccharide export outer membrane protein
MRMIVRGVPLAMALVLTGCSHFDAEPGGWHGRLAGEAPTTVASRKDEHWQSVPAQPERDWSRQKVVEVSYDAPAEATYTLDTGDTLRIFVYGQQNLSRLYTVDARGSIMIPLLGVVRARGLTTSALASRIRARLGSQYVRDPHVTVDIHENRPFFILGEVRQSGKYPYVHGMTIEMAVAIAGGYTPRASERRVRVSRAGRHGPEMLEGGPNFMVRPGDTITIQERFF